MKSGMMKHLGNIKNFNIVEHTRGLPALFLSAVLLLSSNAGAVIMTDIINVDRGLENIKTYDFLHDFTDDGFVPGVDKIMAATARFEFVEIIEGDSEYEGEVPDDWEFIILYSRIFDGRSVFANVDTGPLIQNINGYLEEFSLAGFTGTTLESYTSNLWLGNIIMEIDVDKGTPVPEPSPLMLLGLSLLGLGLKFRTRPVN